jgi:hypothetical protein
VGSYVLARLEQEAAERGINYVYNSIRDHAGNELVHDWLVVRGFRGPLDGDLRKRVSPRSVAPSPAQPHLPPGTAPYSPAEGDVGPGREDAGGYTNVEHHTY